MTPQLLDWMAQHVKPVRSVLESGAFDVNGSARSVIKHETWFGTDMRLGPGVDWVCKAENLQYHFGPIFDLVVCCEMLEHAENWRAALTSMWNCVRFDGCLVLSTPGHNFPRHDYPDDFQRFSIPFWENVFYDQHILNRAVILYPHEGHIIYVRKINTKPLDFARAGEPLPVPPGPT